MFNRTIKLACALSLISGFAPLANANDHRVLVTSSHAGAPATPKYQDVARCVRSIQRHWEPDAKLVLQKRGRLREESGYRVFSVDGWVWQQGERQQVSHECATELSTNRFALNVAFPDRDMVAQQ